MDIKLEQNSSQSNIEVVIKYAHRNKEVERILALLKSVSTGIRCEWEGKIGMVSASDIFYIESVDKRTFLYLEKSVCRTAAPLYKLAAELEALGFLQINKACILNIAVLEYVKPLPGSRMEATLKNGERLYITRKFLNQVKRVLEEEVNL